MESLQQVCTLRSRFGKELERDRLLQFEITGAVDLTHPTAPEQTDDAVAPTEQCAGRKPALPDFARHRESGVQLLLSQRRTVEVTRLRLRVRGKTRGR